MKLKEKVDFLINKLEEIYPTLKIPLDHKDPYTLLIAVLLSAQSTDKKVNEITPNLFNKADNPCLLYTSPSPRDATLSRMPSSA